MAKQLSLLGIAMLCMALSTQSIATKNKKNLFIFGDSLLDTGNGNHSLPPRKKPFGITYPGHPTGRFSDRLVFTDFLGSFLGMHTPIAFYRQMTPGVVWQGKNGINFGRWSLQHNIQPDYHEGSNAKPSISPIISGNDYVTYMGSDIINKNLNNFTKNVTTELTQNLQKLHEIGVGKVAVAALAPSGCLPQYAYQSPYPGNCNKTLNGEAQFHNQLLKQKLKKLNKNGQHVYIYVDFYNGFLAAMDKFAASGSGNYTNPTKGCCLGEGPLDCGRYEHKKPKYILCDHPDLSFFWDIVHPAQRGWHLVFAAVKHILTQLL